MLLTNFSLVTDVFSHGHLIALDAHGVEWDLHNFADFHGFVYWTTPSSATLTLNWRLGERILRWRNAGSQYEVPNYPSNGFRILFSNVDYLEVTPRDVEMPRDEDISLSSVSFIEAHEDLSEYIPSGAIPDHDPSKGTSSPHMMFRFNGGQVIRVGAEEAEFVLTD